MNRIVASVSGFIAICWLRRPCSWSTSVNTPSSSPGRDQGSDQRAGPALQAAAAVPERDVPGQAHLTIDTPDAERFITAEKMNVLVDAFVKWRIVDPAVLSASAATSRARDRMSQIVKAALNEEITKRTVREVISGQRGKVMEAIRAKVVRKPSRSAWRSSTCA
jgi:hypothetical protein